MKNISNNLEKLDSKLIVKEVFDIEELRIEKMVRERIKKRGKNYK